MTAARLRWLLRVWPPFVFSGIRVTELADDWSRVRVELRAHWYNRNYVGTHFGGSLFAMTDPWWMILLLRRLGPEFVVWDRAGEIEFVKPGRGTVAAEFRLDAGTVAEVRAAAAHGDKHLRWFEAVVTDAAGEVVARVRKQVYVRRKPADAPGPGD